MDKRYSVWSNKTDRLIICAGTSTQCAKAMGIKYCSFFSTKYNCSTGKNKKWTIIACEPEEL